MTIKNKFEKFLLSLSSFFLLAILVLGFKVNETEKKLAGLVSSQNDPTADPGLAIQDTIGSNRDNKLNIAAHAPLTNSNTQTTIKTVIPGKTITQTVPASSSSKSSSSSSSKTTKTS